MYSFGVDFLQRYKPYIPRVVFWTLCGLVALVWFFVYTATPSGHVKVAILNVGQGDSIYIESPTGQQVVIDGGPDSSLLRELPKVMPWFDHSLDMVVATHPDSDHIVGFVDLLSRYHIGAFMEPGVLKNTQTNQKLEKEVLDEHIVHYIARRGMMLTLGGGAVLRVLSPDTDVSHLNPNRDNDAGIVLQLVFGSTTALFMADIEHPVEDKLIVLDGAWLKSDVLKVGHHGSRTASEDAFIGLVHPQFAAISVAAHNTYRLPNQEPIDTLKKYGAEVLRTDEVGTVVFESDGKKFWLVK